MSRSQYFLATLLCTIVVAPAARAADFIIDPTQSFLTISGTHNSEPIEAQAAGSLTDHLTGNLLVDLQTPGQLQITGSTINGIPHPGDFFPIGGPADFAGQGTNYYEPSLIDYASIRRTFEYVTSAAVPIESSGEFNASPVQMRLESPQTDTFSVPNTPMTGPLNLEMSNVAFGQGTLTAVGNEYRLVIPFQGQADADFAELNVSGQLVATRPIAGSSAPDIPDGGFESHYGGPYETTSGPTAWSATTSGAGNYVGPSLYAPSGQLAPVDGLQLAYLDVEDGTASIYQTIIPGGKLQPDTIYRVTFDVGNPGLMDNFGFPYNEGANPFVSVKGFFTLGNDLADFSQHVGDPYFLAQLSTIADSTWSYGNTVLLDTSLLTPEQLAEPLNFVLQATSTTDLGRGRVNFDDVRLAVVPEPAGPLLAAMGFGILLAVRLRRKSSRSGGAFRTE